MSSWLRITVPGGVEAGNEISADYLLFGKNADFIFFQLNRLVAKRARPENYVKVDVWNYKDSKSAQLSKSPYVGKRRHVFYVVKNVDSSAVVRIDDESHNLVTNLKDVPGDYAIISDDHNLKSFVGARDYFDNQGYYLVSMRTGERKLIWRSFTRIMNISPEGKYLVYFDEKKLKYFSYEISSGILRSITSDITVRLDKETARYRPERFRSGWNSLLGPGRCICFYL